MSAEADSPLFTKVDDGLGQLTGPSKPSKLNGIAGTPARKIGWAILAVIGVIAVMYYRSGATSIPSGGTQVRNDILPENQAMAKVVEQRTIVPRLKYVMVGTQWYTPGADLDVHVFCQPDPGDPRASGVEWQTRFNYDDKTIRDMPPIDGPAPTFPEYKQEVRVGQVRVKPGKGVIQCPFKIVLGESTM